MHVVHLQHTFHLFDMVRDVVHVEALGHGVGAHAEALVQQAPGGDEDDHGDGEADDGVDDGPAGVLDDDAGDDHADRDQRVGQHVEEGAAGVDVVLLLAAEGPGGEAVDDDADGGGPDDEVAAHVAGVEEFLYALHHDGAHGDQEDDGVEQRDEHRGFAAAIGEALGGVAGSQLEGYHGQQEREDVAQVVAGIGKEAEGVADEARNGFDDDEEQVERDGDDIDGGQFLYSMRVVVMVVAVVVFVFVVVIMVLLETVFMVVVVFHNFDGFMF